MTHGRPTSGSLGNLLEASEFHKAFLVLRGAHEGELLRMADLELSAQIHHDLEHWHGKVDAHTVLLPVRELHHNVPVLADKLEPCVSLHAIRIQGLLGL